LFEQQVLGESLAIAITDLEWKLDKYGITALDPENSHDRRRAVHGTLQITLETLPPARQRQCYELSVFAEDVEIPFSSVQCLWALSEREVRETLKQLALRSLLRIDLQRGTIRIHDVIRAYFASQLEKPADVHGRLVDGWGGPDNLRDVFAWEWCAWHLSKAERPAQLHKLLTDTAYMSGKLRALGPNSLVTDFQLTRDKDIELIAHHSAALAGDFRFAEGVGDATCRPPDGDRFGRYSGVSRPCD
jgi:hypothetical protein